MSHFFVRSNTGRTRHKREVWSPISSIMGRGSEIRILIILVNCIRNRMRKTGGSCESFRRFWEKLGFQQNGDKTCSKFINKKFPHFVDAPFSMRIIFEGFRYFRRILLFFSFIIIIIIIITSRDVVRK